MSDPATTPTRPTELQLALGDLGPARRHLQRIRQGILPLPTPAVIDEIARSVECCAARLTILDKELFVTGSEKP